MRNNRLLVRGSCTEPLQETKHTVTVEHYITVKKVGVLTVTIWLPQFIYPFYWTTSLAQYPCMTFTNVLESQIKFLTFLESKAGSGTPCV